MLTSVVRRFVSPLFLLFFAPSLFCAEPAGTALPVDDAFSIKTFQIWEGGPTISPDSKSVASVVCDPTARARDTSGTMTVFVATRGAAMYSFGCDVVLSNVEGTEQRNVTGSIGNNWAPSWSPDGGRLAFYSDRGGAPHLWLWDRKTGGIRRASEAVVRTNSGLQRPMWLRNGSEILVTLRPEGMTDAELEADLPGKVASGPEPDAQAGSTVKVYRSGEAEADNKKGGQSAAAPVTMRLLTDIARVDVRSGKATTIVRRANATAPSLSPDGSQFLYFELKPSARAVLTYPQDLVTVDLATGARRVLAADIPSTLEASTRASWSPDGKSVAYLVSSDASSGTLTTGGESDTRGTLAVVPVAGGTSRTFTPTEKTEGFDADDAPPLWSEDGRAIYVVGGNRVWRGTPSDGRVAPLTAKLRANITSIVPASNSGIAWAPARDVIVLTTSDPATLRSAFQAVSGDGKVSPRVEEQKRYAVRFGSLRASPDGTFVVFDAESSAAPEDRWMMKKEFTAPTRVTHLNPQVEKYPPGESRIIEFRSADGEPLRAALFLPAGYQNGKRYPLIALVYASGMGSRDVNSFGVGYMGEYNYQILTTRGYAILAPDIPVHTGTPMRDLMKSVMPAIDKVVELGIADPERLGVTGQSNGGYSTLALIAQTRRFKAAVMNSGFGDLAAFYGSMNKNDGTGGWHPWLEKLGGAMHVPPWENPMRYVENSPIYYLDKVETPLIMQSGADDDGIVEYSDQVFVALKRLDKNVTYLRYRDERHLLERHANKLDYWERVLPFWEKYLKAPAAR